MDYKIVEKDSFMVLAVSKKFSYETCGSPGTCLHKPNKNNGFFKNIGKIIKAIGEKTNEK